MDNAFTGSRNQRPNKVSDDFYGGKTDELLQPGRLRAAGARHVRRPRAQRRRRPELLERRHGAVAAHRAGATQRLELRLESFNLLNHFNWGIPLANFNAGTFGRITTQAGEPRIIQFGIKYDF